GDLRNPVTGDPAYDVWDTRQSWITTLKTALLGTPKTLAGLEAMLQNSLGVPIEDLKALDQERQQGNSIEKRLDQLTLPANAFFHVMWIYDLVAKGVSVLSSEWDDVYSILIQVSKRRSFADWRSVEETLSLVLGPDHFKIPDPLPLTFPPQEPAPLPAWRATHSDRQDWQDTLQSRIDQEQGVRDALAQAVGTTEEVLLPKLRDALVWVSNSKGWTLEERAKWFGDTLLID